MKTATLQLLLVLIAFGGSFKILLCKKQLGRNDDAPLAEKYRFNDMHGRTYSEANGSDFES